METVDDEFLEGALDFMARAVKANKPFFVWHNTTRMHAWTRLSPKCQDKTGHGLYADGMQQVDDIVGVLLKKLDDLGIADNTIVVFSTDNGPEKYTWPDGGASPFRGEKGSTWEGGMRVPQVVRWPGLIKPGTVVNGIMSHEDWAVTLLAAAGESDVKEKLKKGHGADGRTQADPGSPGSAPLSPDTVGCEWRREVAPDRVRSPVQMDLHAAYRKKESPHG